MLAIHLKQVYALRSEPTATVYNSGKIEFERPNNMEGLSTKLIDARR